MKTLVIDASLQDILEDLRKAKTQEATCEAELKQHWSGSTINRDQCLKEYCRQCDIVNSLTSKLGNETYAAWLEMEGKS